MKSGPSGANCPLPSRELLDNPAITSSFNGDAADRVIVAMSGGVDSSVAAKLLVDQGYDVLGITMKLTHDSQTAARYDACCSPEDQQDAHRVACQLGFPHKLLGFEAAFERDVISPFCQAYLAGKTPNPCIACNRYLKFGVLQNCRKQLAFDYVATGHYARRVWSEELGRHLLLRGVDQAKDQSYFLYHLNQETLSHMLFPLGECTKQQIRALAGQCGLVVADKPESQDICFVEDGDYAGFIERHESCKLEPGPIVDAQGQVLGQHEGLARYTIGQRKGLCVAWSEPLYVLAKDVDRNALVVGTASEQGVSQIWADDVNLIAVDDLPDFKNCQVKAMYRQRPAAARVRMEQGVLHAVLDEPLKACAPGQALVVYDGDVVIGGGTIQRSA